MTNETMMWLMKYTAGYVLIAAAVFTYALIYYFVVFKPALKNAEYPEKLLRFDAVYGWQLFQYLQRILPILANRCGVPMPKIIFMKNTTGIGVHYSAFSADYAFIITPECTEYSEEDFEIVLLRQIGYYRRRRQWRLLVQHWLFIMSGQHYVWQPLKEDVAIDRYAAGFSDRKRVITLLRYALASTNAADEPSMHIKLRKRIDALESQGEHA